MGMFDIFKFEQVEPAKYDQALFHEILHHNPSIIDLEYQTKDLHCELATYHVYRDGSIGKEWKDAEDNRCYENATETKLTGKVHLRGGHRQGSVEPEIPVNLLLIIREGKLSRIDIVQQCTSCGATYPPAVGHSRATALITAVQPDKPLFPAMENPPKLSKAATDVLAERERQKEKEGWTEAHDDTHDRYEMADAAAAYAVHGPIHHGQQLNRFAEKLWPVSWHIGWFKPSTHRRNCVKAAALLLAEIERIDRAESKRPKS